MVTPLSTTRSVRSQIRYPGFSLIELMIAVAIAGVVMAFGLPMMQDVALNQRVRSASSDFHTALLLARSEAIKRGGDVDIDINASGWEVKAGAAVLLIKNDLNTVISYTCSIDADTSPETCPANLSYTRTGRLGVGGNPFEIRFFINGNSDTITRCVGISLSGIANVSIDTDGDPANGC